MIGSLRGILLDRSARPGQSAELIVEVGGVGYRVVVPAGALAQVGLPGGPVFLHVHTHVREDAIVLYGFPTREERVCFEALIGAHGVGPAVALGLLSTLTPAALRRAVDTEDVDTLMLVPGIGRKTATRLLVELASRLDFGPVEGDLSLVSGDEGGSGGQDGAAGSTRTEVRSALAGLGYGADEIRHALAQLPADGRLEDHLRLALRQLATTR